MTKMSSKEIGKREWKWEKSREMKKKMNGRKNDMKRKEEKKK